MIQIRHADERGKANFGWLDSQHTFSFGSYYDARHMGFSALRVINDDRVAPGAGFETHGHRDMEIISYVTEGIIEHKDSEGHSQRLPAGEFQLMSAGSGIYHSEFNGSQKDELRFLQIWIRPNSTGGKPSYQQKDFGKAEGMTLIASPDGEKGSLLIKQDAQLLQLVLGAHSKQSLDIKPGRNLFIHLVEGELLIRVAGHDEFQKLIQGDGAMISEESGLELINGGESQVLALVFDLP